MKVQRVLLARPRGYCAGVEMAIKSLAWMVRIFDAPVYCYHEIVHNKVVVERFEKLGVVFVDNISEVPRGAPLMLSAHGSSPELVEQARDISGVNVNAVCPLVTKAHHEVKVRSNKGYSILYVGHGGHDEAKGTMAVAPESITLIENEAELDLIDDSDGPVALISQTTLSLDEWSGIRQVAQRKFPNLWMANRSDLCFATTNRQLAVREISSMADAILVIGSANSSNTLALETTAKRYGAPRVCRINDASELPDNLQGVVGVTAGASAPEDLVTSVLERLSPAEGFEEIDVIDEDEYFPPPPELRDLLRAVSSVAALALVAPNGNVTPLDSDRTTGASQTLSQLGARLVEND